jgi:hypothetical protein
MSLEKLEDAIRALPPPPRDERVVAALARALGQVAGREEIDRLRALWHDAGDTFDAGARAELDRLSRLAEGAPVAPLPPPVKLTVGRAYSIDVPEPSGLAFISPALGFVTIGDDSRAIFRLALPAHPAGEVSVERIEFGDHSRLLRGLEGIAYDADSHSLLVVSEDSRVVSELSLEPGHAKLELAEPIKRQTLDAIGREKGSGWEGITVLPARLTPDRRARLLLVNEKAPREIAVLDRRTFELELFLPLPKAIEPGVGDLSDLTVDERTGHLFLLSDEGQLVLETLFEGRAGQPDAQAKHPAPGVIRWSLFEVGRTPLPDSTTKHRLQPEGLAFDQQGDLWVVSEGDRSLRRLER